MREIRPYGSVRGVRRKPYPYRDTLLPVQSTVLFLPDRNSSPLDAQERSAGFVKNMRPLSKWPTGWDFDSDNRHYTAQTRPVRPNHFW